MPEDDLAVVTFQMLVEAGCRGPALARTDASVALRTYERIAPQVVPVQLDQVEGVQEHAAVVAAVADAIELRRCRSRRTPPPHRR